MPSLSPDQFQDYRGWHQPDLDDPAIHHITDIFPDDVYTHPHYYGHSGDKSYNREAGRALRSARGNPSAPVDVYRSVPHGVTSINTGDWVTTSPTSARHHGRHATDPSQDWPVLHAQVPAHQVRSGGNDIVEWGYSGPTIEKARVHHPGGA